MNVRKVVAGSVLAAGLGVAGMVGAGMASADVSTNDTTADRTGYGIANHIAIFNGDQDGIGWTRSVEKGTISDAVGFNKAPQVTISTQGQYPKISNNP